MAHLGSSFAAATDFIGLATATYAADLVALNSSGVSGSVVVSFIEEEDGGGYVNVAVSADGLTPGAHIQHIHGTFDEDGNPTDARSPTLSSDTDGDGMVEVLEGVPSYGDVLLSVDTPDGMHPMADANGHLAFVGSFDIEDMANFLSPVSSVQYSFEDIVDLVLREYVIHGMDVPAGIGEGTTGEVNGTGGFTAILPAASGEFEAITADMALDMVAMARAEASMTTVLTNGDDSFDGGLGDDVIVGKRGDDTLMGGGDDDRVLGNKGRDMIDGGDGMDWLRGGAGDDRLFGGAGEDNMNGGKGHDLIVGGDGDDLMIGGKGADIFGGLLGNDILVGGIGRDEFHFDAGTGTDMIRDFQQGVDVISLLDNGAVAFANSDEDASGRGDSDLSADDFVMVSSVADLRARDDQKVAYSDGMVDDLMTGTGAAIEAYVATTDGTDTYLAYDDDWSTAEGRETIAILSGQSMALTVSDFDVY